MSVLIIGATGMLGQELGKVFAEKDPILWSRKEIDISNGEEVENRIGTIQPDIVINAAAYNHVDGAEQEKDLAKQINGLAVGYIARAVRAYGGLLIHYSTDYVFKGDIPEGYNEAAQPDPQSVYAQSKFFGEQELAQQMDRYYLIRLSRLFGKKGTGKSVKESFVDKMIRLSETHESVQVINEEVSNPTFATDLAKKTKEILDTKKDFGIYHVTNAGSCTWYEFAQEIFAQIGWNGTLEPVPASTFPRPAERPKFSVLINTKLPKMRTWQEALKDYLHIKGFI
ncbi:dTDP-4-dehydrorhamnose reductase [Patescibacteria group bacterium]